MKLTRPQVETLHDRWMRNTEGKTYLQFRRSVMPEIGGYGAVMVFWSGMWLGIEKDGYGHT